MNNPMGDNPMKLEIKNSPREKFKQELLKIKNGEYVVETLADGREILIKKPGGKKKSAADFLVKIYDPEKEERSIRHRDVTADIRAKKIYNSKEAGKVVGALLRVCEGEEPESVLNSVSIDENLPGEKLELLLKVYKWIWGQEDCNYPPPNKGRYMSMEGLLAEFLEVSNFEGLKKAFERYYEEQQIDA
ncbi:MAG: glutamyl-tRNA amidotransferase [Elusimicrobiota bacterium]